MDDDDIRDLFAGLGPVSIRRMFGGKGIYHEGLIIAVDMRGVLLVKGDADVSAEYEAAGARRWSYDGKGRPVAMPYWYVPVNALDDPDEMADWARKAYGAAVRSEKAKSEKAKKNK